MTDDEASERNDEANERDDEASESTDRFGDDEVGPFEQMNDDVDDPFAELDEGGGGSDSVDPEPIDSESTGPDPTRDEPDPGDALFGASGESGSDGSPVTASDDTTTARTEGSVATDSHGPTAADPHDRSSVGSGSPADDPFDELGPAAADDAEDGLGDAFEQMDVSGIDEEDVWESIDEGAAGDPFSPGAAESSDARPDEVEHVVDKRTYCQQCPHFSAPPDVACTHEGTTIAEAIGFDEFRVRNCPMVSEDDPTFDAER